MKKISLLICAILLASGLFAQQDVVWHYLNNCTYNTSTNVLTALPQYGSAISRNILRQGQDGSFTFTSGPDESVDMMIGFCPANMTSDNLGAFTIPQPGYALRLFDGPDHSLMYNDGTPVYISGFTPGDVFKIEIRRPTIYVYRNGTLEAQVTPDDGFLDQDLRIRVGQSSGIILPMTASFGIGMNLVADKQCAVFNSKEQVGGASLKTFGSPGPFSFTWSDLYAAESTDGKTERNDLAPGSYTVGVRDLVTSETQSLTVDIPVQCLWRMNEATVSDNKLSAATSTDIARFSSNNTLWEGESGWFEFSAGDFLSNMYIGLLGFDPVEMDGGHYVPETAFQSRLSTATDQVKANQTAATTKTHLVHLYRNTLEVLFNGSSHQKFVCYAGDIIRIGRNGGTIYISRNGKTMYTSTYTVAGQHLILGGFVFGSSTASQFGMFQPTGMMDAAHITKLYPNCSGDATMNWSYTRTYDEYGNVRQETKEYLDLFGRTLQSQTAVQSKNTVLLMQPVYDAFGRAVGQTLPAPSGSSDLCYNSLFFTNTANAAYRYADFDLPPTAANASGEIDNPAGVGNSVAGTLGWYYSNNNNKEAFVAADQYPYTRVEYSNEAQGRVARSAGVGLNHKMGSTHENRYIYTSTPAFEEDPASNELNYVFPYRSYELEPDFSSRLYGGAYRNFNLQLYKTISINPDGRDQISYTTSSGQVIATCTTGDDGACASYTNTGTLFDGTAITKPVLLYMPLGKTGTLMLYQSVGGGSPVYSNLKPVLRDNMTGNLLVSGTDFTYNTSTGLVSFTGVYAGSSGNANRSLYLSVSMAWNAAYTPPANSKVVFENQVDYTQWTLYFYDKKDRLLSTVSPADVACQQVPYNLQKTAVTGLQPFSCSNTTNLGTIDISTPAQAAPLKEARLRFNIGVTPFTLMKTVGAPTDFSLKSDAQQSIEDSISLVNDPVVSSPADTLGQLDTALTAHVIRMPTTLQQNLRDLLMNDATLSMDQKYVYYKGQYTVKAELTTGGTAILEPPVPFGYKIYFNGGNPVVVHDQTEVPALYIPSSAMNRVRSLSISSSQLSVSLNGFGTSSDPLNPCDASVHLTAPLAGLLNSLNAAVHLDPNLDVVTDNSPVTLAFSRQSIYDEYDRLIGRISVDQGRVDYVYDQKEDKLLFSQNDQQRLDGGKFSRVLYDVLGRTITSGVYDPSLSGTANPLKFQTYTDYPAVPVGTGFISTGTIAYSNASDYDDGRMTEKTNMAYDAPDASLPTAVPGFAQRNTGSRISKSYNDNSTTWYSYNELGQIEWTVQNIQGLGYKTMESTTNIFGELQKSTYQRGNTTNESIVHQFLYDADARVRNVSYTYQGNTQQNVAYEYYQHGPLKRTVLGGNLQGLDYVYTIEGLLKSVNNPMATLAQNEPGQDGYASGLHSNVAADLFGYTLDYYTNDYSRSGSQITSYNGSQFSGRNNSFAGRIKAQRWRTTLPAGATSLYSGSLMQEYNYDQLGRLTASVFGNTILSGSNIQFLPGTDYAIDNMAYDKNGNLQNLRRKGVTPGLAVTPVMDDLTYIYDSQKRNRLLQVQDAAGLVYTSDLDMPNQTNTANYVYNAIGQMIENKADHQHYEYFANGLIKKVYDPATSQVFAEYTYNDRGLRNSKKSYNTSGVAQTMTWYVYDGAGSQIATYQKNLLTTPSGTSLKDFVLYGIGRVGTYSGGAVYELTDHLGNVRGTVKQTGSSVEILSYMDYYPHGGVMPGRNYVSATAYKYGYQGQEKDVETGLTNFELRQYDPRLGRWYNPDPNGQYHSPYLAMSNNPVSVVDPDGGFDTGSGNMSDVSMALYKAGLEMYGIGSGGFLGATPFDRNFVQQLFGTSYEAQVLDKVLTLASTGGFESSLFGLGGTIKINSQGSLIFLGNDGGVEVPPTWLMERATNLAVSINPGAVVSGGTYRELISASTLNHLFAPGLSLYKMLFSSNHEPADPWVTWTKTLQTRPPNEPLIDSYDNYLEMNYYLSYQNGKAGKHINVNTTIEEGKLTGKDVSIPAGPLTVSFSSDGTLTTSVGVGALSFGYGVSTDRKITLSSTYTRADGQSGTAYVKLRLNKWIIATMSVAPVAYAAPYIIPIIAEYLPAAEPALIPVETLPPTLTAPQGTGWSPGWSPGWNPGFGLSPAGF